MIFNDKDWLLALLEKDLEIYEHQSRKMTDKIYTLTNRITNIFDYSERWSMIIDSSLDSSMITESSFSNDSSFISYEGSMSTD